MSKRDFLALEEWSSEAVDALLTLASRVKRGEISGGLERKVLAMVFIAENVRDFAMRLFFQKVGIEFPFGVTALAGWSAFPAS